MATLKQVLRRKEERSNLNAMGVCVLAVIGLTAVAFLLINLKLAVPGGSHHFASHPATVSLDGDGMVEKAW